MKLKLWMLLVFGIICLLCLRCLNIGVYNLRGEACAFHCASNGVSIEGIEGSTPPGETKNFAAVVQTAERKK